MNIKTKLTYGIGLLFVLITLLGGLAIKNIHNVSAVSYTHLTLPTTSRV